MHDKEGNLQAAYHFDNSDSESLGDENVEYDEDDQANLKPSENLINID